MFMLGKTFMDTFTSSGAGKFVPPFIGNPGDTKAFGALIGLGIILTIPGVVKMMRSVFGAPAFELGSIGAAVGAGVRDNYRYCEKYSRKCIRCNPRSISQSWRRWINCNSKESPSLTPYPFSLPTLFPS